MNAKIFGSILDYPHPGLDPKVWGSDGKLLPKHKEAILSRLNQNLQNAGLKHFEDWYKNIHIVGSLTTYQYTSTSDCDIHIYVDMPKFIETEKPGASVQEAEVYLDGIRKEFFTDAEFYLPGTKHPAEFYFVTPKSSDDTTRVGIYDLMEDEWIKDPVKISKDFDIEEAKPKFIEEAAKLAGELDISLGDIKRQISRIEELQETIKTWDGKTKKMFKDKLEAKIEYIEGEIQELVDIKTKMVQTRHTKEFDATSEDEIKFKYLQRFGYFYIITQLKELLEVTEDTIEVTEDKVPEIKEIVTEPVKKAALDDHHNKLMIDFDQTIAHNTPDREIGEPMPGVKEAFDKLKEEGWSIIIYSGRANTQEGIDEIREFMKKHSLPFDEIFIGKPIAEYYIDDRNIVFTDWKDVLKTIDHAPKKTAQHNVEYEFSSTHFVLPKDIAQQIVEWSVENIPNEDLYDDETKRYGRELESHITVLFGLLTNDSKEVEKILKGEKPVRVKFKKTKVFANDMDAIFIEVESEDIDRLHKKLKELDNEDQQPDYHPHCTVAYVKSGLGKKYTGEDILDGLELELDTVKFSPKDGDPVFIELSKKNEKTAAEAIPVNNYGTIYKNPTADDAEEIFLNSSYRELRWGATENRDLYIWNASSFTHHSAASHLGLNFGYQNMDTGWLSSVEQARDWANRFEKDRYERNEMIRKDRNERNTKTKVASFDIISSFIEKKAKLHWFTPGDSPQVVDPTQFDLRPEVFQEYLNKGYIAIDENSSPKRVLLYDFEFTPDWLDRYLGQKVGWGEDVILVDRTGRQVPIHFPTKNIKRQIQRELYPPEDKAAAFMPSIVQAPDNPWQGDSDVEIPVDPDTVSDEETSNKNSLTDKPKKGLWQTILDMFKSDDKEASLKKNAYLEHAYWVAPDGVVYTVRDAKDTSGSHDRWVEYNIDILEKYGVVPPNSFEDHIPNMSEIMHIMDEMYEKGWIRIGDSQHQKVWGITLQDIRNVPRIVENVLTEFLQDGNSVTFENADYTQSATVEYPWRSLQKEINHSLMPMASLKKKASAARGWLDPNGKFYNFGDFNYSDWEGVTHDDWVQDAETMLFDTYGIELETEENPTQQLIDHGWVRISDDFHKLGVHLQNIKAIPDFVESHLLETMGPNTTVTIEDTTGVWVEVSDWHSGLQKAVNKELRHKRMLERQQPVQASFNKHADVLTDILKLVKDTGGATYNFATHANLAGTDNYAVSIYPQHSQIVDHELTVHDIYNYVTSKRDLLLKPENSLGIWNNGGKFYLDVSLTIPDKEKAIELGKKHNQISIFDLKNFQEIPTGGTGEVQSKKAEAREEYWINPQGKVFLADEGHNRWILMNLGTIDLPASTFGVDLPDELNEEDAGELNEIREEMLSGGWVRIGSDDFGDNQFIVEVDDLQNVPPTIDNFIAEHFVEGGGPIDVGTPAEVDLIIENPFPTLQKAINKAIIRRHRRSSLGLSKYATYEGTAWVDPEGQIFRVPSSHAQWAYDNVQMLEDDYGMSIDENALGDEGPLLIKEMLEYNWTRVAVWHKGEGYIQIADLKSVPPGLQPFLDENYDWQGGRPIIIDDLSGTHVEVDVTGDIQKDIRHALRRKRMAHLETTAFSAHAFWIAPDKQVYEVRGKEKGRDTTHAEWVRENAAMLQKKYKIRLPKDYTEWETFDINSILIDKGWTRIGDYHGSQIGIRTLDIHHIPSTVEDVLATFATEGSTIHVEDINQEEWATVTYPFRSLQREVNRFMQDLAQKNKQRDEVQQQEREKARQEREERERKRQEEQDRLERELTNVPIPEQAPVEQPQQMELPLSAKSGQPETTWDDPRQDMEPSNPLPHTFQWTTNDDNLNSRYPWRFMKKPTGPNYSNEDEVNDILMDDEVPLSKHHAALRKEAMGAIGYWISPEGVVYNIRPATHIAWISANRQMLNEAYDIPKTVADQEVFDELIEKHNWIRIGDSPVNSTSINVQVNDLRNIPPIVDEVLASIFEPGMTLDVEEGGTFNHAGHIVQISDPFPTLQKAVNKALVSQPQKVANAIPKFSFTQYGFWVAPDGKAYSARDGGARTHGEWVLKNAPLLQNQYGIADAKKRDYFDVAREMLEKGWARIGDTSRARGQVGVEVGNIKSLPSYIDNALASFMEDGQPIIVADLNDNWAEVTWPFKSLQQEVRRSFNRRSELLAAKGKGKPKPCSPQQVNGHIAPDGTFYDTGTATHGEWSSYYMGQDSQELVVHNGWVRIAAGSGKGFMAESGIKPISDAQWKTIEDILFGGPGQEVTFDRYGYDDMSILKPITRKDLDRAGTSLREFVLSQKPWRTFSTASQKTAYTDKDVKNEAYGLWQEAIASWESKVHPIEEFIMSNGGIAAYTPSADTRKVEEREEYRGIPVRFRGTTPYDVMIDRLKAERPDLLSPDAAYGDLYEIISHLPERGRRPTLWQFIDDAKRNLEHEEESYNKEAGNESNTYSDEQMEDIYEEQHAEDGHGGDGSGGNVYHDWNRSTTDFPKPEDTERKQKIHLDLLDPTQTPPIASYEVTWFVGQPRGD